MKAIKDKIMTVMTVVATAAAIMMFWIMVIAFMCICEVEGITL